MGSSIVVVKKIVGKLNWETGIVVVEKIFGNWLARGSINTKRNGGYAQLWQPIGREK